MNGWKKKQIKERMNDWKNECIKERKNWIMNERKNNWKNKWILKMYKRTNKWTKERKKEGTNAREWKKQELIHKRKNEQINKRKKERLKVQYYYYERKKKQPIHGYNVREWI